MTVEMKNLPVDSSVLPIEFWEGYGLDPERMQVFQHGHGLINHTYLVKAKDGETCDLGPLCVQCINTHVFQDPEGLMNNLVRILDYLDGPLRLIRTRDGGTHIHLESGTWRIYNFVGPSYVNQKVDSLVQARQIAAAFGQFHIDLAGLEIGELVETIPGFHDTARRYAAFERALSAADPERIEQAADIIERLQRHESLSRLFVDCDLPLRVVHNDTKVNNVLISQETHQPICIIDLDTVMPGTILSDYGDLVRTSAARLVEDDPDAANQGWNPEVVQALREGYLGRADALLEPIERELLDHAPSVLTYELALRFLTDWLERDHYFRIDYPTHNLVRARNQITLVESGL